MSNYRSGADFERALVRRFVAEGWTAHRVAGSKGTADVYAFGPDVAVVVDCKREGWATPAARVRMWREWGGVDYVVPLLASWRRCEPHEPAPGAEWRRLGMFASMTPCPAPWLWGTEYDEESVQ